MPDKELITAAVQWWTSLSGLDQALSVILVPAVLAAVAKFAHEAHHAFTNCLPTIDKNTGEMRDMMKEFVAYAKGVEAGEDARKK